MSIDSTAFRSRTVPDGPFSLENTFVHLKDVGAASALSIGPDFWNTMGARGDLQTGRLVWTTRFDKDMPHWEMHQAGDELLVVVSGAIELVLQGDGRSDRVVELGAGQAFLVPFGIWHRVRVKTPSEILFVTPGKGNQHRPI
jgi:mannose-6-phosphate isomerase-like protein (cupin superfamily)